MHRVPQTLMIAPGQDGQGTRGRMNEAYRDAVAALYGADPERDYIVISSAITRELHAQLSDKLASVAKKPAATLFLTTYGGDPDGGYRIARCLRHYYKDNLRVAVPSWCKSAGTLVAIAADELAIGDRGELGPLDVQVFKGSELQERSSGLDITEALGMVSQHVRWGYHSMLKEARRMGLSTKLAAEMAAHIGAAIAEPLLNQVDPLRLGELQRATRIASEYGTRLNTYSRNLKDDALNSLIHDYPSHSFVIDRKEATTLFHRVGPLTLPEQAFVNVVWTLLADQGSLVDLVDFSILNTPETGDDNEQVDPADGAGQLPDGGDQPDPEPDGHPQPGGARLPVRPGGNGAKDADGAPAADVDGIQEAPSALQLLSQRGG